MSDAGVNGTTQAAGAATHAAGAMDGALDGKAQPSASPTQSILLWWANGELSVSPDTHAYFLRLMGDGIESIRKEPHRLLREQELAARRRHDLAVDNLHVFLESAQCTADVRGKFVEMSSAAERLRERLPRLLERVRDFQGSAGQLRERWEALSNTVEHHAQVLEIMEAPLVMDTCVRSGLYSEALDVRGWSMRLQKRFPENKLVQSMGMEVEETTKRLLDVLLATLGSNIDLSAVLHALNNLRQTGIFTEPEVRQLYLQARDSFLRDRLAQVPTDLPPYEFLSKYIEHWRVVFDIINQYQAMFLSFESFGSSNRSAGSQSKEPGQTASDAAALNEWVHERISNFFDVLSENLGKVTDASSIAALLEQAAYLATSLARVGVDFRGILAPMFEQVIEELFDSLTNRAVAEFRESFPADFAAHLKTGRRSAGLRAAVVAAGVSPVQRRDVVSSLLEWNSLAVFTNGLLRALNELRVCAPLSLKKSLGKILEAAVLDAVDVLESFRNSRKEPLDLREKEAFAHICKLFDGEFVPYVFRCFDTLYRSPVPLQSARAVHDRLGLLMPPAPVSAPVSAPVPAPVAPVPAPVPARVGESLQEDGSHEPETPQTSSRDDSSAT